MNSFKISLKNIQKCRKDYSVYFMTLIIGVAIFYLFNSLGDQEIVKELPKSGYDIMKLLARVLEIMSVFVAFTLGLLIVYANNFLIKRRKKEFGVYLMLGMSKKRVSRIIIGETLIVGMISLMVGTLIGIFGSQFLSVLVVKMFEANVKEYVFSFSTGALKKTLLYFSCIFLVVMFFNTFTVAKYKLIDLLNAEKHSEKKVIKNPMISAVITGVSIAMLIFAYVKVGFYGNQVNRNMMILCILMGIVATFGFFFGLSGFLFEILRANKKMYFQGLNSFVVRQYSSNITSGTFSVSLICLMLFMSISAFSMGFSLQKALNDNIRKSTPVDINVETENLVPSDILENKGMSPEDFLREGYVEIPKYHVEDFNFATSYGSARDSLMEQFPLVKWETLETIYKLSDYNRLARLYGREEIELAADEYAVICDYQTTKRFREQSIAAGDTLHFGSHELHSVTPECIEGFDFMSGLSMNTGVFVLSDALWEESDITFVNGGYLLAGDYQEKNIDQIYAMEERIDGLLAEYQEYQQNDKGELYMELMYNTKRQIADSNKGLSVTAIFIVMYLGIVFIISSAAILALKTLSDSIDSVKKYEILEKIGAGKGMMQKALFANVAMIFCMPLVLAIVHSVFGLLYAKTILESFSLVSMFSGVVITVILMLIVYGGYMLASYLGSLRIVGLD